MLGLLIPILIGCVVGALRVRSLAGLQRIRIEWWPLALASIAVQLVLFDPPFDRQAWALAWGPGVWVVCLVAQVAVLARNGLSDQPGRSGFVVAAVGVAVNLFVVCANGGYMPLSTEAQRAAHGGVSVTTEAAPSKLRNVWPATPQTRLALLGD